MRARSRQAVLGAGPNRRPARGMWQHGQRHVTRGHVTEGHGTDFIGGITVGKKARRRKGRKKSKANHGRRPNA